MYKRLKFSWAHIMAFLALIFIGYVSFVGLTYMIDDGFAKPTLWMLGILITLAIWFIGAQQLKGVDNSFPFAKCIWWERFFVFTSPFVLVLCLIPLNHAFNVASQSEIIENTFKESIYSSKHLFEDYDVYAQRRISNYQDFLNRVKDNKNIQPAVYEEVGFKGNNDSRKVQIEVQILTRQLTANYDSLKSEALNWIDHVDRTTSVWNVFLLGNIKEIKTAILDWRTQMGDFSKVILQTEQKNTYEEVVPFDANEKSINQALTQLDSLANIYSYSHGEGLNLTAIIVGTILFILLFFPYLFQERDGRSTYTLLGRRYMEDIGVFSINSPKRRSNRHQEQYMLSLDEEVAARKLKNVRRFSNQYEMEIIDIDNDVNHVIQSEEERHKERQRRRNARKGISDDDEDSAQSTKNNRHSDIQDDEDDFDFSQIDEL